jgi:hypothetical protein
MFIPLKMVLIGIDPYPYDGSRIFREMEQKNDQPFPSGWSVSAMIRFTWPL